MSGAATLPGDWAVPAPLDRAVSDRNQSIWLYIGRMHEAFNDPDRALAAYENVLKHNQSNVQAIVNAGLLHMKKDHLPAAMAYLLTAVQIDPANGDAWRALAYSYIMNEDMEKAYHAYSNALANLHDHRDPHLWFGVGIVYDRIGRLDDALRAFDTVLAISPTFERSDEVYYSIGLIYKEQGNYNMAHSYMAKIISINSSPGASAEAWYQIGTLHDLANNTSSATEAYQAALSRLPTHTKCLQALSWLVHKSGNSNKAVELLQRAMAVEEGDGTTYYLMGRIYMANQEFRIAYDNYQRAVHLDGKNANFWCSIASLYYQRQQYRDAMDAYSRAVHINPDIGEIWYDLGILYEAYAQFNDAMDSYRRALDLQPQNTRFSQRLIALRNARTNGTALTRPNERPLTDGPDMSPTTRSGQRPHIKCDVIQRYGLLPPPPVVQQPLKQSSAMPVNQMSAVPASRAVTDERHLGSAVPPAVNGTTTVTENGMHQPSAIANVSNGIVSHSNTVMAKQEGMPISSHAQRSGPVAPNGSGEPVQQHAAEKDMRYAASAAAPTGVVAHAQYSSQLSTVPQQDSRMGDLPRAAVSPSYRGPASHPMEQRPQQIPSRTQMSSEYRQSSMPQQYSQPMQATSGLRNAHDVQSNPTNGMTGQEYSQRGESKWPATSDRIQTDSRAFPTSRPEASSGYPRTEATVERNTAGSSITQPGALPSMPSHSARIGNDQTDQTGIVAASRPTQSPVPPYTTSHSQYANGAHSRYQDGPQSNPAVYPPRGTESSSFPDRKEKDGLIAPLSHAPRQSVSDEPSRRSVSSSHEKIGHGPLRSSEMVQEASNHMPASSASNMRGQTMPNGERVDMHNEAHVVHRETSSSRLQLLNPIREGQIGSKVNAEKADSPVDEEMLPRLPPLPPSQDDQPRIPGVDPKSGVADRRAGTKSPLAPQSDNRGDTNAQHGNSTNGTEPKVSREASLGSHGPPASAAQDTRHHGPPNSDTATMGNGFSRKHDNPSVSQSDMYGGRSASPAMKRFSEGMAINGTSLPLPHSQMLPGENGMVTNGRNGHMSSPLQTVGKSPEARATTTITASKSSPHGQAQDGKEGAVKTVSPMPSSTVGQRISSQRPASSRQSPEQGSISRHSSGQLGFAGNDSRVGRPSESYNYTQARDRMEKSPQPSRVPSTGIRSSLQHDNSGGLPTLKKPRLQTIDGDGQRGENFPGQTQPNGSSGVHVSSLRNPFGSGMSASFSKSLSRSGPSGPIGVASLKGPGVSDSTTRTTNSEGLTLRSPEERGEDHAMRDPSREDMSGLGKRNAATYEIGNMRPGQTAGYGKFLPKSAVIGPSTENKVRSPEGSQQQSRFSGGMPSYHPGMDGRNFGDSSAELNRPKVHHTAGDSSGGNRFSGGDL